MGADGDAVATQLAVRDAEQVAGPVVGEQVAGPALRADLDGRVEQGCPFRGLETFAGIGEGKSDDAPEAESRIVGETPLNRSAQNCVRQRRLGGGHECENVESGRSGPDTNMVYPLVRAGPPRQQATQLGFRILPIPAEWGYPDHGGDHA
ncbi:hypothetical protein [Micromonospora echinaurantiaca]|uniref:hypothetical protein n=1 Tax=Micromonospora echinaurantiaca TaxID=47857 RepID=UPI0034305C2E